MGILSMLSHKVFKYFSDLNNVKTLNKSLNLNDITNKFQSDSIIVLKMHSNFTKFEKAITSLIENWKKA